MKNHTAGLAHVDGNDTLFRGAHEPNPSVESLTEFLELVRWNGKWLIGPSDNKAVGRVA